VKKFLLIFLCTIFVSQLIVVSPTLAGREEDSQKIIVLARDEVIDRDYFAFGDRVTISGTVNGDVYTAAGVVIVDGVVNGDLIAGGGSVFVRGEVVNDVRVVGGQVTISGDVGGNVTTGGGSVTFTDGSNVVGSVVAGAGALSLFGPIGKGITVGGGDITIGNSVAGDVIAGVGQLTLTSDANVQGDLKYWSSKKANVQTGAIVLGETIQNLPKDDMDIKEKREGLAKALVGISIGLRLISLISSFIIGLLFIKFLPVYTQNVANKISSSFWSSFGVGFVAVLLTPFLFVMLLLTVVGIPIGFILLTIIFITLYISKIFVALALGNKVLKILNRKFSIGWTLVVGFVVYAILVSIPIVGFFVHILAVLVGLGAILIYKKDFYKQLRTKKLA